MIHEYLSDGILLDISEQLMRTASLTREISGKSKSLIA
jgi:hypothetical protein